MQAPGYDHDEAEHDRRAVRDDRLVQSLYGVADEVEDDDLRDRLYGALDDALEAWAPDALEREKQRVELFGFSA